MNRMSYPPSLNRGPVEFVKALLDIVVKFSYSTFASMPNLIMLSAIMLAY